MNSKEVDDEKWAIIPGASCNHQISNTGKVKTFYLNEEKIMKPSVDNCGYEKISISINGKRKTFTIHKLVALFFLPNPLDLKEINHIDGNKRNNNVNNLEWCTRSENVSHAFLMGLKVNKKGEESLLSKEFNQFDLEGNLIKKWRGVKQCSKELGINDSRQITQNLHGRSKTCMGWIFSFEEKIDVKKILENPSCKKVISFDPITKEQKIYNSVKETEKDGFQSSLVVKCCKGKRTTHGGKTWKYMFPNC